MKKTELAEGSKITGVTKYRLNPKKLKTVKDIAFILGSLGLEIDDTATDFENLAPYFKEVKVADNG
jgi:hypothetical protein